MWQDTQRMDFPKADEIRIQIDTDEVLSHKFTLIIGKDVTERQVLALTYDEAVSVCDKLQQALQEYSRLNIQGGANEANSVSD